LWQIANVFVVQIDVHKRAQLALFGVEMFLKVRMRRGQRGKSIADCSSFDAHRRLFFRVYAERCRYVDFHSISSYFATAASICTGSSMNFLSSSPVPVKRNEFVTVAV